MVSHKVIQPIRFDKIIGGSRPMLKIYELIKKVADSNAKVLIDGETGTGKGLVAIAIHKNSLRRDKPFVAVNCSALVENLLESELFGHEKGAFTGAVAMKKGRFELADGGTLFLDEIGELSKSVQVKLLNIIQDKEFERVGGTKPIRLDVRLIAASHKDLEKGVREGWFREDLFYRLNVIKIQLPPLRDRKEDIPSLVEHLMGRYARENNKDIAGITDDALEVLKNYSFPGNIRELENIMERAVVLANDAVITIDDLPEKISRGWISGVKVDSNCSVKSEEILSALKSITIFTKDGNQKRWHDSLRGTTIKTIHEFLVKTNNKQFYRKAFAKFLNDNAEFGGISYKTTGDYLKILKENQICVHNNKYANKSGYSLSDKFIKKA